jgi:GNAT superfamily N-acetyltransferase
MNDLDHQSRWRTLTDVRWARPEQRLQEVRSWKRNAWEQIDDRALVAGIESLTRYVAMYGGKDVPMLRLAAREAKRRRLGVLLDSALRSAAAPAAAPAAPVRRHYTIVRMLLASGARPSIETLKRARAPRMRKLLRTDPALPRRIPREPAFPTRRPSVRLVERLRPCTEVTFRVLRGGVDVNVRDTLKAWRKDLRRCTYRSAMVEELTYSKNPEKQIVVAALSEGQCIAAASSTLRPDINALEVTYLCSAKTCRGAGTLVMKKIEAYARSQKYDRIVLMDTDSSRAFYTKLGYGYAASRENDGRRAVTRSRSRARVKIL